ncbi:MAG: DUF4105 domain-containing protein [Polyangiaceae bacterium]
MPAWAMAPLLAATTVPPRIDVYTMGQGDDLFERFGHAAICVTYPFRSQRARCFNYGTTDFGSPPEELGWAFLRGNAKFWVSVWDRDRMLQQYVKHDRTVWVQTLPLSPEAAQTVAARLEHDALPENREYVYHHFRDNCSTRVRDIVDGADGGSLEASRTRSAPASFRGAAATRLSGETGLVFAADFLVGRGADVPLSQWDAMFLPDQLRTTLEERYGVAPHVVYERRGKAFAQNRPQTAPLHLAVGAALTSIPALLAGRAARLRLAAALLGTILGLLALVPWCVAALTQVPELRFNEVLLLLLPTDFVLLSSNARLRRQYLAVRLAGLVLASLLLGVGVLRQPLLVLAVAVAAPLAWLWQRHATARFASTTTS